MTVDILQAGTCSNPPQAEHRDDTVLLLLPEGPPRRLQVSSIGIMQQPVRNAGSKTTEPETKRSVIPGGSDAYLSLGKAEPTATHHLISDHQSAPDPPLAGRTTASPQWSCSRSQSPMSSGRV